MLSWNNGTDYTLSAVIALFVIDNVLPAKQLNGFNLDNATIPEAEIFERAAKRRHSAH